MEGQDYLTNRLPPQSRSCQCTQCRRQSGALVWHAHVVPQRSLRYVTATDTLRDYEATPGIRRGFCADCGSWLYWRRDNTSAPTVALAIGTVDPQFLLGGRRAGAGADPDAPDYGYALANSRGGNRFRDENEICRVTDGLRLGER